MTMEILKMMETGKGRQAAGLCLGLCNSRMVKIRYEYTGTGQGFNMAPQPVRRNSGLKTGLIIILVIVGVMFVAGIGCNALISGVFSKGDNTNMRYEFREDYVGVLALSGR